MNESNKKRNEAVEGLDQDFSPRQKKFALRQV